MKDHQQATLQTRPTIGPESAQQPQTIREKILALLERDDNRSMVEIIRHIPEATGPFAWVRAENVIVWQFVSPEFVDTIKEMQRRGELEIRPAAPITYIIDGCSSSLPIAKSVRAYAEPHWLPVLLCRPRARKPCRGTERAEPQL